MTWHRLTNVDSVRKLADCSECGPDINIRPNHKRKGVTYWRCSVKYRSVKDQIERPWTKYKKSYCEWEGGCDFKIQHPCQLSVDHIDGNRYNNEPENLQTLCLNHHSLKTQLHENYKPRTTV